MAADTTGPSYDAGLTIRKQVMGKEHVERALGQASNFSAPIQELVTRYAWGEIWCRPGLEPKVRSMLNVAMLTALNRPQELAGHIRGAINNGVTEAEIQEILLQTMIYCGAPAALESFRVADKVLQEIHEKGNSMGSTGRQAPDRSDGNVTLHWAPSSRS